MEQSGYVVAEGEQHKRKKQEHTDNLSCDEEFLTRFATCEYFVNQKDYVAAVEGRDWKEVHYSEHYREQGKDVDEREPVPFRREDLSHRDEAAHRLVGFGARCEDQPEILDITSYCRECQFETRRDCLGK